MGGEGPGSGAVLLRDNAENCADMTGAFEKWLCSSNHSDAGESAKTQDAFGTLVAKCKLGWFASQLFG